MAVIEKELSHKYCTLAFKTLLLLQLVLSIKNLTSAQELNARNSLHLYFDPNIWRNEWSNVMQEIEFLEDVGGYNLHMSSQLI